MSSDDFQPADVLAHVATLKASLRKRALSHHELIVLVSGFPAARLHREDVPREFPDVPKLVRQIERALAFVPIGEVLVVAIGAGVTTFTMRAALFTEDDEPALIEPGPRGATVLGVLGALATGAR